MNEKIVSLIRDMAATLEELSDELENELMEEDKDHDHDQT